MIKLIITPLLILLLASCEPTTKTDQFFDTDTTYVNKLTIPGLCDNGDRLTTTQIENCVQTVVFKADGFARITLTDIINSGNYSITDDTIFASFSSVDAPPFMKFTLLEDESLVDDIYSQIWLNKAPGTEAD